MKILLPAVLFFAASIIYADEPGWTDQERAKHREVVLSGTVDKIEKIKNQDTPKVHLMRAIVRINVIEQGAELIGDSKNVVVYYETSPLGAGYRCPTFPVLAAEASGRFYLRYDEGLTEKESLVLGMGSDFQESPQAEQGSSGNGLRSALK